MNGEFDRNYWEEHWVSAGHGALPAHPALNVEIAGLRPGTAIEAGSGAGAEAIWLAAHGWAVTAVDISGHAIRRARSRPVESVGGGSVTWLQADLSEWEPEHPVDLVTTFYAHPAMPQHAFYERISHWVAPGGTLLVVGHHHDPGHHHGHGQHAAHPENAVTGPEQIRALLDPAQWSVHTAEVRERTVILPDGPRTLRDVIARAVKTTESAG